MPFFQDDSLLIFSTENTVFYYYPMDKTADTTLIGDKLNGVLYGNPSLTSGTRGSSLQLTPPQQYVDLGEHRDRCIHLLELCSQGWSMAMWMKPQYQSKCITLKMVRHI